MSQKNIDLNLDEYRTDNEYERFAAELTLECFNEMNHEELKEFLLDCLFDADIYEWLLDSYRIIDFVVATMYEKVMERCFQDKDNLDMVTAHRMEVLTRKKKQEQLADPEQYNYYYYDFLMDCVDMIVWRDC